MATVIINSIRVNPRSAVGRETLPVALITARP